ncbi:MAG: hypothetical protein FJ207_15575 [Gemmatimonadetes bacterium]|nr:hypothetical protein [Gemmatimonadota bacterium]
MDGGLDAAVSIEREEEGLVESGPLARLEKCRAHWPFFEPEPTFLDQQATLAPSNCHMSEVIEGGSEAVVQIEQLAGEL